MNQNDRNQKPAPGSAEADELKNAPQGDTEIEEITPEDVEVADVQDVDDDNPDAQIERLEGQVLKLNEDLEKSKKDYVYLMAEFDNFRKRTIKEKSELIRNGGENVLKGLLPILDDFERGLKATESSTDAQGVREGMELIYNKLKSYLEANGVKEIESTGQPFNEDFHEAVAAVPVADEAQNGQVLDTVQKGYTLNDKVIRHAKVAVGKK